MKIALVQFQSSLASPIKNAQRHLSFINQAQEKNADLVVFPELSLFSYPVYDLPENKKIIEEQKLALNFLSQNLPSDISVLVGGLSLNKEQGKNFFNSAFLLSKEEETKIISKKLIPSYDIFDEYRHIEPAKQSNCNSEFSIKSTNFLLHICEDSWFGLDSFYKKSLHSVSSDFVMTKKNIDYVINMSASPFFQGKERSRLNMAKNVTSVFGAHLLYVNAVGASDEMIFDGRSFVYEGRKKKILLQSPSFKENLLMLDTKLVQKQDEGNGENKNTSAKPEDNKTNEGSHLDIIRKALCFGLSEFVKQSGFKKIHLGLSGGVDSAVVACLAVEALGKDNVKAFSLPSAFSSPLSFNLALEQTKLLNITLKNISIESMFQNCKENINTELKISDFSVIHENLQARLRSIILMAYSQKEKSLLLNTSNKSEIATGYSTLYGDLSGALCPIGDLLKTEVYALAEHYCKKNQLPKAVIQRPPTAELRKDQLDQDSLPKYEVLDFVILKALNIGSSFVLNEKLNQTFQDYVKSNYSKKELELAEEFCYKKMFQSEFKRFQSPPILKVSEKSFGQGRKMPIANHHLYSKN
ncbi:MAG: NAD(+) synthase [Bdellovibrionaceae bacterium]|nr:NAD(+) synthase [Pseudobdellovibrionaceae bacterium]